MQFASPSLGPGGSGEASVGSMSASPSYQPARACADPATRKCYVLLWLTEERRGAVEHTADSADYVKRPTIRVRPTVFAPVLLSAPAPLFHDVRHCWGVSSNSTSAGRSARRARAWPTPKRTGPARWSGESRSM